MAFDGLTLNIIKSDIEKAIGSRIEKVNMPNKYSVILTLSSKEFSGRLLLCCNPSYPRIHFTTEKYENPQTPPMICMLLRKRYVGGRLKSVRQQGLDRVLYLDFLCHDELGDEIEQTIIIEVLGRLSNIIFTSSGRIIDCVRRFDPEEGKRFLISGAVYEPPTAQDKINILNSDSGAVIDKMKALGDIPADKALSTVLDGASPIVCRELCSLSFKNQPTLLDISDVGYERLKINIDKMKAALSAPVPTVVSDKSGKPIDYSFTDIHQYGAEYPITHYKSMSELLDKYYTMRDNAENIRKNSADLLKLLTTLTERTRRKIEYRKKDLKATENRDKFRIRGELIKANIHQIKPGDSVLRAVNYYDENCKEIDIPLDPSLSAAQNAQKNFHNYKKASVAAGLLNSLIEKAQEDLDYFESVFDSLSRAKSTDELEAIRRELIESGFLKPQKNKKLKPRAVPYLEYEIDGYRVLAGKNNIQNDTLTLKTAQKNDIWLHTKDIPGSHVIIFTNGENVPDDIVIKAANIAAVNSKGADSSGVPVEYCLARYVKKPSGAKPGMVIYTNNKTLFVTPNSDEAKRMQINS